MQNLIKRWRNTCQQMQMLPPPDHVLHQLLARYSEEHRKYHTIQHLEECFDKLDEVRAEARRPGEIELALWFHDAVYDVRRHDNEEQSAALAASCLSGTEVADDRSRKVQDLILATSGHHQSADPDTRVMLDVDLSILGAAPARFAEYEQQIRSEYQHVPDAVFIAGRQAILERFLRRPQIFMTRTFFDKYEQQARTNLINALTKLHGG